MMHHDWIESAWAAHSCDLRHYARGYCGNVEQAEDAVQDAFLKLQQTTPAVAGDPPRPWLFRVVRNRLVDLHRRSRREQPNDILPALAVDADDPAVDTEAIAALNQLPPRQREAMVLRFRGGLSYDAIAEVMGTSHSNVGVLLHKALRTLRDCLLYTSDAADE